jgi:citrate lyase gamma subunit
MHLDGVRVEIRDRGALDYVIRARVKSAAERLLRKEEESAT